MYCISGVQRVERCSRRTMKERAAFRSRKDTAVFLPRGRIRRLVHARFCKPQMDFRHGLYRAFHACVPRGTFAAGTRTGRTSATTCGRAKEVAAGEASKELTRRCGFPNWTARFELIEARNGYYSRRSWTTSSLWKRCQAVLLAANSRFHRATKRDRNFLASIADEGNGN